MPRFDPHPERRPVAVTGASSGIGAAIAQQLAALGHPVVLGARRVERCEDLAATLRADGHEAAAVALDLTDDGSVARFAEEAAAVHGPLEVLVSNAGEVWPQAVHATDPATFTRQVQVNLLGAQALLHAVVPGMVERGRGDVVLVTSDVVRAPRPLMGAYMTAKHGAEGMARAMQMELEGTGVRAGIVRPGPSSTEQGTTWSEGEVVEVVDEWNRWGLIRHDGALRPGDVARAVTAMVTQPRGTHLTLIEVEPEAPAVRRTHVPRGEHR
ncbi:SDR family oxidoreductase [Iamia sp. SCSIO 61187]|uniref:SDR family oxidoreductase n=1 Tax=Iamia sp. SCSIO 61187 TaxID=2722752 RepID=UPI001C626459|nr:SDR family oxidoreductase [Iamia sp. SCSIO 61187]QYG92164.1 SDR family oxidoreductase [Iamia sp. SCSIO 61187]